MTKERNLVKDIIIDEFQFVIQDYLVYNRSVLDILSMIQESNSMINREIIRAATHCGCISIDAKKQEYQADRCLELIRDTNKAHITGKLCDNCKERLEKNIGQNLFYLASLCNTVDLDIYDIIIDEIKNLKLLGKYNLR